MATVEGRRTAHDCQLRDWGCGLLSTTYLTLLHPPTHPHPHAPQVRAAGGAWNSRLTCSDGSTPPLRVTTSATPATVWSQG